MLLLEGHLCIWTEPCFLESCPEFLGYTVRYIKKCYMVGLSSNLKSQPKWLYQLTRDGHNRGLAERPNVL